MYDKDGNWRKSKGAEGRGVFEDPIEIQYVQIPRDILNMFFIDYQHSIPEASRKSALWHYIYNFLTNRGMEALKRDDTQGYMLAEMINQKTFILQNNARWINWDDFYLQEDIDFDEAMDRKKKRDKDKKKKQNKNNYAKRKAQKTVEQMLQEDKERQRTRLREFADEHDIDIDINF